MPRFGISEKAVEDINGFWVYTAENWSVEQAVRYYNLIFDEIEYIAEHFEMARDIGEVRKGYGSSKVKSHLVFFRKMNGGEIEVVRVLRERMEIEIRLTD